LTYQSPTKHLIRGRSWEALNCGAMLLEEDNASIRHFLEPMKHYVPFSSMEDAVHKSRYFMAHDAERNAIAQAGNRVAAEQYSESAFWSKCFRLIYA
jgi:spore maturation protein CgeB